MTDKDPSTQGKQVKRIDFTANEFEANGKTYFIESAMPVARFMEFEILQLELAQAMTIEQVYKKFDDLYKMLNQQRFADCAVMINGLRDNAIKRQEREPTVLKLCALFMNTHEEDRTVYNNDVIVKKIADWKEEGIDMRDFFAFAFNTVPGLAAIYNKLTQGITEALTQSTTQAVREAM